MRSTRRQNERTDQVSYLLLVGAGGQQATSNKQQASVLQYRSMGSDSESWKASWGLGTNNADLMQMQDG